MNRDVAFGHRLADAADAITVARFRALDLRVETKPDLTPVSEADRAAEEAIRELVRERPGEGVLGEELGDDGSDVRWVVDPIDGTRNYVRGVPVWGTLLALQRDGRTDAAVVSAPALGRRWWAARGEGAFAGDGEPLQVSTVARIEDAVISTGNEPGMPPGWRALTERAWTPRAFGDFWQHCLVAEGAVELATDPTLALWDYAAVQLIVEEAGGRCTTFGGEPPSPGASFLAANAALHAAAVAALSS